MCIMELQVVLISAIESRFVQICTWNFEEVVDCVDFLERSIFHFFGCILLVVCTGPQCQGPFRRKEEVVVASVLSRSGCMKGKASRKQIQVKWNIYLTLILFFLIWQNWFGIEYLVLGKLVFGIQGPLVVCVTYQLKQKKKNYNLKKFLIEEINYFQFHKLQRMYALKSLDDIMSQMVFIT